MVKLKESQTLYVFMNGREVGLLCRQRSGGLTFKYSHEWIAEAKSRPISLSLPISPEVYEGARVYNFFDNLLPNSERIRDRIQAKFKVASAHPFDLLAAIGTDCVGAIQLCHSNTPSNIQTINAQPLSEKEIANLLQGYANAPLGMGESADDFRISIAGAQEKTALLWYQQQWCRPFGNTPTSHIFKLPIGTIDKYGIDLGDSCENEWLCLEIARTFGLPTAKASIQTFEEVKALVVTRFDRQWSKDKQWLMRLPQEDMCQALGVSPGLKYQSDGGPGIADIMQILRGGEDALAEQETFLRSQILFWLLAAIDGHAKNFSLYLQSGGRYRLTPLYDIISAYPLMKTNVIPKQKAKMAMAVTGKKNYYRWTTIQPRHFVSTAEKVGFSSNRVQEILRSTLQQVETVISQVNATLPPNFPNHVSDPIFQGMAAIAQQHL